ncbi:MAG: UbiA family prenyltransferase [Hyphomicrobium sp.]
MMATSSASRPSLALRLWIYQAERLPLAKTATLLVLFTAASINVSAALAGVARPGYGAYLVAFIGAFVFFAHLRVCDEIKDAEDDARYRPERPIPRGLVTLSTIVQAGLALVPVALAAAAMVAPVLIWPMAVVWVWMALMTVEFFAPAWLKSRPLAYLVSHMLIMPLIDLFVTACEWLPRGASPPDGLWLFLALSFVNGCVLEIGRKIYAPSCERMGVETYSATWGIPAAINGWSACLTVSAALLVAVGFKLGAPWPVAIIAMGSLAAAFAAAFRFVRAPVPARQKQLDLIAGLWVAMSYATAGFVPVLAGYLA